MNTINNSLSTNQHLAIKQWSIMILLTDQAYHLFELFKQNPVLIRT